MSSDDVASRKEEEEIEEEEEKDTLRVVLAIGCDADNNGLEWCPKTEEEEEDQREVQQLLLPKRFREQKDDDEVTTSKRHSIWRRLRRIVDRSIARSESGALECVFSHFLPNFSFLLYFRVSPEVTLP
jgi:hypothetical protein